MAEVAPATKPKKAKKPRPIAVIREEGCTGCEACIVVCPVDCIHIVPGEHPAGVNPICRVDTEVCIGCTICAVDCPWDTIDMVFPHDGSPSRYPDFPKRWKFKG
ncbi:MAG: 4Fe-4S dicluster domain-containing protein [Planctomycetota bacterium]|nr:4Fe-4S dicluster domain-containing protein [Planctomycetota bacterium]